MRCTTCDYPLWNLNARECPECGSRFAPSEFEFISGSVQFCCPHCRQVYYGTGENGHLQPVEFDCVTCGRHVHMDEMLLRPADGLEDRDTVVDNVPWLERKRIGFLKGWFGTVWKSMLAPHRVMHAMPAHGGKGQSWLFMLLTVFLSSLVLFGGSIVVMLGLAAAFGGWGGGFIMTSVFAGYWLAYLVVVVIYVVIWGMTAHGLLRMTGATRQSIGQTYSALCFASGPMALGAIPCFGMYLAMPWWVVAGVLMVHAAQCVSGWRATLAVVTWPVVSWLLIGGAYLAMIFVAMPAMQGGMATARSSATVSMMQAGVLQHAVRHGGAGPRHAAALIDTNGITAGHFAMPGSYTQITATPIGDADLFALAQAGPSEFERIIEGATADLPAGTIAHRLGDFVFTYHGIDLENADRDLWIFVTCADPNQNQVAAINGQYHVGTVGWLTETLAVDEFDEALEAQNRLRAREGLPPLPHPWRVTHQRPMAESEGQ